MAEKKAKVVKKEVVLDENGNPVESGLVKVIKAPVRFIRNHKDEVKTAGLAILGGVIGAVGYELVTDYLTDPCDYGYCLGEMAEEGYPEDSIPEE